MSNVLRFSYGLTISLFAIYFLKNIVYPSGILSAGVIVLIIFLGLISCVDAVEHRRYRLILFLFAAFYIMNIICYIVSPKIVVGTLFEAIGIKETLPQLVEISVFCFCFFIGYSSGIKNALPSVSFVTIFIFTFIIISILQFYLYATIRAEDHDVSDGLTNNASYFFICLIPYLPLIFQKKRIISMIYFIIIVIFVMWGAKRGAILCLLTSFAVFALYYLFSKRPTLKRILPYIFISIGVLLLIYLLYESNTYLQRRLERQNEIGLGVRELAYYLLWNHWLQEPDLNIKFFGNGMMQTITVWGNYAHNDWLELLIDNGFLGVFIYALMLCTCIAKSICSRLPFNIKLSMFLCVTIWFMISCFSMGYAYLRNGLLTLLLGILFGCDERYNIMSRFKKGV